MKRDDDLTLVGFIVVLVLLALGTLGDAWWASRVYGDWTCAFSRCVRVEPVGGSR